MKIIKAPNTQIKVPDQASGTYPTDHQLPKAHGIFVAVARRKGGKSVAISNLARMMDYDRIFLISPTASSNKTILDPLGIDGEDIYEDLEDKNVINYVIEKVNQERDDYEKYLKELKEYKDFLKMLNNPTTLIPDTMLLQFYKNGVFRPPQHKYTGKSQRLL